MEIVCEWSCGGYFVGYSPEDMNYFCGAGVHSGFPTLTQILVYGEFND